jgi:1,4-dihydroxy-2-naphthoyl-CoA hydrolase
MPEYRFNLGMSSVDPAGVLFFPELFRHAHDAYEAFMADVGVALDRILAEGEYALPIVHAEADYTRPLRHGTRVSVGTQISKLGESSFVVDFDFRDEDGQSCATAKTVHVVIERGTGKRTTLPDAWRTRLAPHLERQR